MTTLLILTSDHQRDLKTLEEGKELQHLLNNLHNRDFETRLIPNATVSDLIKAFQTANQTIEVLHFAGHAEKTTLHFMDNEVNAAALAEKIRLQKTLKLVFLNGCATLNQVAFFHDAGVPFVIGTTQPVQDVIALKVAGDFYLDLIKHRSIRKAMMELKTNLQMLSTERLFDFNRGTVKRQSFQSEEMQSLYELFVKEGAENEVYNLPLKNEPTINVEKANTIFLNKLIFILAQVNNSRTKKLKKLAAKIERGIEVSEEEKKECLMEVLPLSIGHRLQKIFALPVNSSDEDNRAILYDYIFFFETLFLHGLALGMALIWENKNLTFLATPSNISVLHQFLQSNRMNGSVAEYAPVIKLLHDWLKNSGVKKLPFDQNLINYLENNAFHSAADFFYRQKKIYHQRFRLSVAEVQRISKDAQEHIQTAFTSFAFLFRYTFVAIRDIRIRNFRLLKNREFDNTILRLAGESVSITTEPDIGMLENKSVLCFETEDFDEETPSFNMFPFIIDLNAFMEKPNNTARLYLFSGYDANTKEWCFLEANTLKGIWKFSEVENTYYVQHEGEIETIQTTHKPNHQRVNPYELKRFLHEFKNYFLKTEKSYEG